MDELENMKAEITGIKQQLQAMYVKFISEMMDLKKLLEKIEENTRPTYTIKPNDLPCWPGASTTG